MYPRLDSQGLEVLGYYAQTGEERCEFEELGTGPGVRPVAQPRSEPWAARSGPAPTTPRWWWKNLPTGSTPIACAPRRWASPGWHAERGSDMEMQRVDTQRAYELIREKITTLQLAPGRADQRAAACGRSEPGARRPFRRRSSCWSTSTWCGSPHATAFTWPASTSPDLQQISELRVAMESLAAGLAAQRRTADDLVVLDAIRQEQMSADRGRPAPAVQHRPQVSPGHRRGRPQQVPGADARPFLRPVAALLVPGPAGRRSRGFAAELPGRLRRQTP